MTNNSQIGPIWTLLGSPILHSLKGKYKLSIRASGENGEHWQPTYFSACPNLRKFECIEDDYEDGEDCYDVDFESFNYGLRENNADWPALETFKVSASGAWLVDCRDWYRCKIDWTILRSLDLRSAWLAMMVNLCGKVPALRFLGFDIEHYSELLKRFLSSTPWLRNWLCPNIAQIGRSRYHC